MPKADDDDDSNDFHSAPRLEKMVRITPNLFVKKQEQDMSDDEEAKEEEEEEEEKPSNKKKAKIGLGSPRPIVADPSTLNKSCWRGCLTYLSLVALFVAAFACFLFVPLPVWKPSLPVFPLFQGTHRKSMQFVQPPLQKHVLADVERSLHYHLSTAQNMHACLCMHHLSANVLYKVCAIYNPYMQRVHLMTDPKIVGHGQLTDLYEERQITSTTTKANVKRYRHVFVQWADGVSGDLLTLQLQGMQAVCMQVAVEEMSSNSP